MRNWHGPDASYTDGDGLTDGEESLEHETDPLDVDTDNGRVFGGVEIGQGTDPLDPSDDMTSAHAGSRSP